MNNVSLTGRLTRDVELRYTQGSNLAVGKFSIAVQRERKNAEGKYDVDFINCVAFGKTAEALVNYTGKGKLIGVVGRIQTGNYTDKDGKKVYTTEVLVDKSDILEWGDKQQQPAYQEPAWAQLNDEDIPF